MVLIFSPNSHQESKYSIQFETQCRHTKALTVQERTLRDRHKDSMKHKVKNVLLTRHKYRKQESKQYTSTFRWIHSWLVYRFETAIVCLEET